MSFIPEKIRSYNPVKADYLRKNLPLISGYIYKKLSSLSASVYILGLMIFFYVIGTIFPQGENMDDYIKAGGKYIFLVNVFNLLDFFSSPLFLLLALILFLNLVICSYERYLALFSPRVFPKTFEPTHTFYLTQNIKDAASEVRQILREELGFRLIEKDNPWIVMEKGLPYRWLTWIYHAGIIICFLGIALTYLFAFEGDLTLKPLVPTPVSPDTAGRLTSLWKGKEGFAGFNLMLDDFTAEYTETPHLDYPKDKISRLAMGLGWQVPAYKITDESLSPRAWKSRVRIIKGGQQALEQVIDVNYPLRYGGYTFYQIGFEQTLKIRVDDNPIPLETKADEDLFVPGMDTPLKFSPLKDGLLYRLDGGVEKLKPFTIVKRRVKTEQEEVRYEDAGRLELGDSIELDGKRIALSNLTEASTLSYRYDPGAKILWWAGLPVLIAMGLRFFGGWYMIAYNLYEQDRITCLDIYLVTKGLGAGPERLKSRLEKALTRNDIKATPLPPLS